MSDDMNEVMAEERNPKLGINELQSEIRDWAINCGWWEGFNRQEVQARIASGSDHSLSDNNYIAAKIALIHSEASEAIEALRINDFITTAPSGKPEGLRSELADIIVRTLDLAAALGFDMELALREKVAYNHTRARKHGGKAI